MAMTVALCVALGAIIVLNGYGLWLTRDTTPPDILTERARRTVILTTKTGEGFRGVLWQQDMRAVVLRNAEALNQGERGDNVAVDGELLVLRDDVAYLQVL